MGAGGRGAGRNSGAPTDSDMLDKRPFCRFGAFGLLGPLLAPFFELVHSEGWVWGRVRPAWPPACRPRALGWGGCIACIFWCLVLVDAFARSVGKPGSHAGEGLPKAPRHNCRFRMATQPRHVPLCPPRAPVLTLCCYAHACTCADQAPAVTSPRQKRSSLSTHPSLRRVLVFPPSLGAFSFKPPTPLAAPPPPPAGAAPGGGGGAEGFG
jgi:hypothetical protein